MNLSNMTKEEIELLSYTDITYLLLKENKKSMTTSAMFKTICDLLEYSEEDYMAKIGDYYTSLTIDKRFLLLENNEWDLRDNHSVDLMIDEEDDVETEEIIDSEDEEEIEEQVEEDYDESIDVSVDDDIDDEEEDFDDLSIIDEEEFDEN